LSGQNPKQSASFATPPSLLFVIYFSYFYFFLLYQIFGKCGKILDMKNSIKNLIIVGPSGSGKGTVIGKLLFRYPEIFELSISCTTRAMRKGDEDGVNYYFISDKEFDVKVENGEFLEYKNYIGKRYGTLKNELERIHTKGKIAILEIETQGALEIKDSLEQNISIFILPDSIETLEKMLRNRLSDDEEKVQARLKTAIEYEIPNAKNFNYQIINKFGEIENTMKTIQEILELSTE
jgi:guanylate kinase